MIAVSEKCVSAKFVSGKWQPNLSNVSANSKIAKSKK
jgi:hypothetical protein